MEFRTDHTGREDAIATLFAKTFTASEGAEEGRLIGALARNLLATTPAADLAVFTAEEAGAIQGCIVFTRLAFPEDPRKVWLLSPVAVATDRQGRGIGQALLRNGLDTLRERGADVAVTYGDPAYYGKVGFRPVGVEAVRPPQPLSMPQGWLAQALTGGTLSPLQGPSHCAPALDDPAYW